MAFAPGTIFKRAISFAATLALFLACAAIVATLVLPLRERQVEPDTQKLARTLQILRTATPTHHTVLKVLFYGQSITAGGWHTQVVDHWHTLYPNTAFVVQNRAIPGFPSPDLVRTTSQDIQAFYPDLIVFHDYGDHRRYADIVRLLRTQTAADVILQTDHGEVLPDLPCREGLHLTRPPGCKGFLWYRQRNWQDEMSYHKIPAIGRDYAAAVEPQRAWWRTYLLDHHLEASTLLINDPHPNAQGRALIATFFNRFFDPLVAQWSGQHEDTVTTHPPTPTLTFQGTRLELVSTTPLTAPPTVTMDGQSPRSLDGCYLPTRSTPIPTFPAWPLLRRIQLLHDHTPEVWTATLSNFTPDQHDFDFTLTGSVSGPQPPGRASKIYRTANLQIDPIDWMPGRAYQINHTLIPAPFTIQWAITNQCNGDPEIIPRGDNTTEYRYLVANALPNTTHTATIANPTPLDHILIYRPPFGRQ
jgi:hypothetical protein